MRSSRSVLYLFIAVLLAVGGWFSAIGAVAQEDDTSVARPGGDLPGEPTLQVEEVATGLIDPINVQSAHDGSNRLFILERTGTVRILQDDQLVEEPFLDISDSVKIDFLEQGLLGMAFHPDYENNGRFFVFYSDYRTNGDHFLVEYTVSADDPNVADPESGRVLLTIEDPYVNHNGGTIHFGPDGYLYVTIGDGGLAGDPYDTAQDLEDQLGNILRIDVDAQGTGAYGIPAENPYADGGVRLSEAANEAAQTDEYHPHAAPEVYVYGLRNAWQFSFDQETGDLYVTDVGQNLLEEINFIPAEEVTNGGHNFGWDWMEGTMCYPPAAEEAGCADVGVLPVAEYEHGENGCSITGVGVHHGEQAPDLNGIYFASDFCSGKFWGLAQDDAGTWQFEELLDTELLVTGSGQGEDGELYVTACSCEFGRDYDPFENPAGSVYRLVQEGGETTEAGADATPEDGTPAGEGQADVVGTPAASPEG